ncbi:MAG: hypothetical protein ACREMY_09715 [bacterium]
MPSFKAATKVGPVTVALTLPCHVLNLLSPLSVLISAFGVNAAPPAKIVSSLHVLAQLASSDQRPVSRLVR